MATVTFFGHRDAPKEIEPTLRLALVDLIEKKNSILFYVGNQGNFDANRTFSIYFSSNTAKTAFLLNNKQIIC